MAIRWPVKVELLLAGTWTDVTSKSYQRDRCRITRGRRSEGSTADPQSCTVTLNNRDGRFSPKNPIGPYYGLIGRNTQLRVSVPAASSYLLTQPTGNSVTCPDNARLDITGDLDIRIDCWMPAWRAATPVSGGLELVGKYTDHSGANQRSYILILNADGTLKLAWSTDGIGATIVQPSSTVPVPAPISGRRAVRATLDVNNGSAGNTVTFYTAASMAGPWVQLGDPVVTAGTTSVYASTAVGFVGDSATSDWWTVGARMRVYSAQILSGIAGTLKASPDFTAQADGATSFADAQGNIWTVAGTSAIVGRDYRFWGEVSEWPKRRDISNRDLTVPITASGIMRRYNRGAVASESAYRRACTSMVAPVAGLVAYWPCEDGSGATSIASGLPGGSPMTLNSAVALASNSESFACSKALPVLDTGSFQGSVPGYADTGQVQVRVLLAVPLAGITDGAVLMRLYMNGSAARWDLVYGTGGTLALNAYSMSGASLLSTGAISYSLNGSAVRLGLGLTRSGSDIVWEMETLGLGSTGGYNTATLSGQSLGAVGSVGIGPIGGISGITIGHITVQNTVGTFWDLNGPLNAYSGAYAETAGGRITRLCAEESISCVVIGDTMDSPAMGPQRPGTFTNIIRECETTDGGLLFEPRDMLGVGYRTLRSLCAQPVGAAFDFEAGHLSDPFEPTEDDLGILNDVTATRPSGSSTRYTVDTGPVSTRDPDDTPPGAGRYQGTINPNPALDADLDDCASWRAHTGTTDDARWPAVTIALDRATYTGNSALTASVAGLDVGDRFTITNPPVDLPPDLITQLTQGYTETLTPYAREISLNGIPEAPYHIGVWGDGTSRYSSDGSTLAAGATSGATSISVATPNGPLWGHADGDFDIRVAGEQMTVTAVSGTTSPQTFTVTRSVNGVVKAQTSGATVELYTPAYYIR